MMGVDPAAFLKRQPLVQPNRTFTLWLDAVPVAMGGTAPLSADEASIWFVGTDDVTEAKREFLAVTKDWCDRLCAEWRVVGNVIPADRHASRVWLMRLGFDFGPAFVHHSGVTVLPFRRTNDGPKRTGGPR